MVNRNPGAAGYVDPTGSRKSRRESVAGGNDVVDSQNLRLPHETEVHARPGGLYLI